MALEDVFHGHSGNRSKADYYSKHLFLRVLCHELLPEDASDGPPSFTDAPRSSSPEPIGEYTPEYDEKEGSEDIIKNGGVPSPISSLRKKQTLGRTPILPTTRGDVAPAYSKTAPRFSILAAKDATVRIYLISVVSFWLMFVATSPEYRAQGGRSCCTDPEKGRLHLSIELILYLYRL